MIVEEKGNVLDEDEEKLLNQMILEYEHIIKIILSKYKIHMKDYDDALQEGRLGIVKAVNAFKEGKGANITSFISLCIERQILSFLRNDNRKKNQVLKYSYSLDAEQGESELYKNLSSKNEIEGLVLNKLYFEDVYLNAKGKMNQIEALVFKQYVEGYTIAELSEEYQIPKKQVYVIIAKAKKKIDEVMNME